MNTLVWILQIVLAVWNVIGGVYMTGHYQDLASPWALSTLPSLFWPALGVVQVALSLGLLAPTSKSPHLASRSAVGLGVISLAGVALYAAYAGTTGALWALVPALLLAVVAYKRKES